MLPILGLISLFFLPIIESFDRQIAFNLLLLGSILISFPTFLKKKLSFDFIDLLWLLVLLTFSLSTISSWSISRSYTDLMRYFAYFLVFTGIRDFTDKSLFIKRFYIPMILVNSVILSFISLLYFLPLLQLSKPTSGMNLVYPIFGHNHLSDLLIFAIPLAISLITMAKRNWLRPSLILLTIFFVLMMIFTFSRGALLALSLAMFLVILPKLRNFQKSSLILGLLTIALLLASFAFSNFIADKSAKVSYPKVLYKPADRESRLEYFRQAVIGFSASPILGTGLDTFRYVSKTYQKEPYSWSWYVHNHYLEIFAETGFLGGLVFLSLIVTLLFRAFKNINHQSQAIFIAFLASTIHSLIDFDWQFISVFLLFFMGVAVLDPPNPAKTDGKKSLLLPLLFFIIIILFFFRMLAPIDSDKLLPAADNLSQLNRAYRLDRMNREISAKLAETYILLKDFDKAHFWYKKAILLDPLDSADIIRKDVLLYLSEAQKKLEDKDEFGGYSYLVSSIESYPLYYQLVGGDYYLFNAKSLLARKDNKRAAKYLSDYIKLVQRKVREYRLLPGDILQIAKNIGQNVY